jgi:putative spermidine/putrescine transport system substrate-binding protein
MERPEVSHLMTVKFRLLLVAVIATCVGGLPALPDNDDAALSLRDNVVRLQAEWSDGTSQNGFGFIVAERGGKALIATANHVVRDSDTVAQKVTLWYFGDQGKSVPAEILSSSEPQLDIAVIEAPLPDFVAWRKDSLGKAPAARGTQVWYVGKDADWYVPAVPGTVNKVSSVKHEIQIDGLNIVVGTSGGPLIDRSGIVGMIVRDKPGAVTTAITIDAITALFNDDWNLPFGLKAAAGAPASNQPASNQTTNDQPADNQTAAVVPANSMDELIRGAQAEGELNVIGLPRSWCNYGALIDGFQQKYGLQVNELNPDAGATEEIEAIKANKGNAQQAPDVVDLGLRFGPSAKAEGLLQPYKVSTWKTIPNSAKDPEGYWYGDYYGVLAFAVNTDVVTKVPQDWIDLATFNYSNSIALSGDPRSSSQAALSVYAAGWAVNSNDATAASLSGLKFFGTLRKIRYLLPVAGNAASLAQGSTPIVIGWDYRALADRDSLNGNPSIDVVVPKKGAIGTFYIQAISAYAPHPNAAKLWMEYLYSDAGQLLWLTGYCHPIRYMDLVKADKIPESLAAKLPPSAAYAQVVFPTLEQQATAKEVIALQWDSLVGGSIQ